MKLESQARNAFVQMKKSGADFPIAIDADGAVGDAFHVKTPAKMLLLSGGKTEMEFASDHLTAEWFQSAEVSIQAFLRKKDRGLPLAKVFTPESALVTDREKIGFGGASQNWAGRVQLLGKHQVEPERVVLMDNSASISLSFSASYVALVARSLSKSAVPCKVFIEIDGRPAFDTFSDKDLAFDESGASYVSCGDMGLYLMVKGLKPGNHELRLMFPQSEFNPVAVYRILLGN
jgi:hypothetical protein